MKGRLRMSRKKYSPEDIIQILRTIEIEQAKGLTLEESVKKVGISLASAARWKKEYGGMKVDQARKLKELELENQRLKKLVADLSIDNQILKEVSKGNF